jgi:hypothetical protein
MATSRKGKPFAATSTNSIFGERVRNSSDLKFTAGVSFVAKQEETQ